MNRQQASEKTMKGEGGMRKKMRSLKKIDLHPWRSLQAILTSSPFRWKRVKAIHHSFFDNVVFRIVSVFEGVVLISTVCFFFLCCGCHF